MGTNIAGRFADQDSYVASQIFTSAGNNQAQLNVAIAENDYLKATPVIFQQQGLTVNLANPVPSVTFAGQQVFGAAVAGIDQPSDVGTGITEGGGQGGGGGHHGGNIN